jgi:hypothetical protein
VPVAGDLHYELAALGGATGQRPADLHVQLECLGEKAHTPSQDFDLARRITRLCAP